MKLDKNLNLVRIDANKSYLYIKPAMYDSLLGKTQFSISNTIELETPDTYLTSRAEIDYVEKQISKGNEWAWCTIKIVASIGDHRGSSSLRCGSYLSRADFMLSPVYEKMRIEAFESMLVSLLDSKNLVRA